MDSEILEGFQEEANQILSELEEVVERLEAANASSMQNDLSTFAQKIDRIMGAANTLGMEAPNHLGLQRIGRISELCKRLGYRAAELNLPPLMPIFAAFWADTLEVVSELVNSVENESECTKIAERFSPVLQKRLEWLSGRLAKIGSPQASGGTASAQAANAAIDVEDLLKGLGI